MAFLKLLRSETLRLMVAGFVVGAIGLSVAQPSMAHVGASTLAQPAAVAAAQ